MLSGRGLDPSAAQLIIDGYEIEEEIGRGGMGVVYRARQQPLNRIVAVKLLIAGHLSARRLVRRFRQEAEAMARLTHPNIVQVYDSGEADKLPFLVLEYVPGGNLARRLRGMMQPERSIAKLAATLAAAVGHAHAEGVIHRDLKPSNILLGSDGAKDRGFRPSKIYGRRRTADAHRRSAGNAELHGTRTGSWHRVA